MANVKITQLPSATTPLTGTEVFPLVQGTTTKQVAITGLFTSPVMSNPTLGVVGQADLINATGLPIASGVAGLGTGIATFLGTPSSANLRTAVTDETGTGSLVFANTPVLVAPNLGTPTFLIATNATGTAVGLTAGSAITNANLTGAVTSVGNATSLGSFTSAQLRTALTDETGAGSAVFATSPTITAPILNQINDTNNAQILGLLPTTSAVDYLVVKNGTGVGVPLHFYADGSSANIGLHIQPKGTGLVTISDGTDFNKGIRFRSSGSAASAVTLLDAVSTAGRVVTLPDATTTLVGRDTTDTLTNKTIAFSSNTFSGTLAIANGGTNASTAALAIENLLPAYAGNGSKGLRLNSGATALEWVADGGGTVTSVAASVPSFLSIAGSPITTSGTLAISLSGTALPTTSGGTGLTSFTSGGVVYASSTSALATGSALTFDGTNLATTNGALIQGLTVGRGAGAVASNTVVGAGALAANTGGTSNTAIGGSDGFYGSVLKSNTSGVQNVGIGNAALASNISGSGNVAIGFQSGSTSTTANYNTSIGLSALQINTASNNTAVGYQAAYTNQTGSEITFVGYQAGYNSTGTNNNFFGYNAGKNVSTGSYNVFIGSRSGSTGATAITGNANTVVGEAAGFSLQGAATYNAFFGFSSGINVTTGTKNTIIGSYSGNQGSLDIRTASNYIVLSDGDGTPKFVNNGSSANSLPGTSTSYNSSSGTFDSTLQIGSNLQLMSFQNGTSNTQSQFGSNVYFNAGYKYISSSAGASKLFIGGEGTFEFAGAVIGTANNPITFTALLGSNGNGYTVYLQGATPNATGTGLTFPATQNASSNANTLDDYEEGTFVPTITFGGASVGVTYNTTFTGATYTKIGNRVCVSGYILLTNKGSSSGDASIGNLPFQSETGTTKYLGASFGGVGFTFANQFWSRIAPTSTTIDLYETTEAGVTTTITNSDFTNDAQLYFSATYTF